MFKKKRDCRHQKDLDNIIWIFITMKKTCLSLNTRAIDVSKPDLPSIHTNVCRPKIFENQYFKKENFDTSKT